MIREEIRERTEDSDSFKSFKHIDEIASREDLNILHSLAHIFPEPPSKTQKVLSKLPSILWVCFVATLAFVIVNSGTDFLTKEIQKPLFLLGAKTVIFFCIVLVFYIINSLLIQEKSKN